MLPAVACLVAGSTGGQVAQVTTTPHHALWILLASFVCWGIGISIGFMILGIYFTNLLLRKLPEQNIVVSVFLSLGPLGQGSFGILECGKAAQKILPSIPAFPNEAGTVLYCVCLIVGLVIWAMAIPWVCFAVGSIMRFRFRVPFTIGWWGFIYPVGTFSLTLGMC